MACGYQPLGLSGDCPRTGKIKRKENGLIPPPLRRKNWLKEGDRGLLGMGTGKNGTIATTNKRET